jgi:hypothetical protein
MPHDWRSLFSELNVPWADRGPNVGPGNLGIACPWCGDDPSHHLSVSLTKDAYYCFRDNRHRGVNPVTLVMAVCDIGRDEATRLLNSHLDLTDAATVKPVVPEKMLLAWDRFHSATESRKCVNFLYDRGFPNPMSDIVHYDLRFAEEGEWVNRLLMPITVGGKIISWTGRALSGTLTPKYRTQSAPGFPVIYAPDQTKLGKVAIIVEGPLDALKIASASRSFPWLPVALCGKQLNSAKLLEIRWFTSGCEETLVALDSDVKLGEVYEIVAELSGALKTPVRRISIPEGYKDPGELPHERVMSWLTAACQRGTNSNP